MNKYRLVTHITDTTPLIVIYEMLDSFRIQYSKLDTSENYISALIQSLESRKTTNIPLNDYINDAEILSEQDLSTANKFIDSLMDGIIPFTICIEKQSSKNLFTLNMCLAYRLCVMNELQVNRFSTSKDLEHSLKNFNANEQALVNLIKTKIKFLKKSDLCNVLSVINKKQRRDHPVDQITFESLTNTSTKLGTVNLDRITPIDNNEAVYIAAYLHKKDLQMSTNPWVDFFTINKLCFSDQTLEKFNLYNPYMFDLNVNFNPFLPESFYQKDQLQRLLTLQTEKLDIPQIYSHLQICYFEKNFYPGIYPTVESEDTLTTNIYEDADSIVCYGIKDHMLTPYTYEELHSMFSVKGQFLDHKSERFENITKLKNICLLPSPKSEIRDQKIKLFNLICKLELEHRGHSEYEKFFVQSKTPEVCDYLQSVFELGMYMRGWDGKSDFPIESALVPPDQLGYVDMRITEAFVQLDLDIANFNSKSIQLIKKIPLGKYINGVFVLNREKSEGLTLVDRIAKVRLGENVDSIVSCIRISSNWIIHTAYHFLRLIGKTPNFAIHGLSNIS